MIKRFYPVLAFRAFAVMMTAGGVPSIGDDAPASSSDAVSTAVTLVNTSMTPTPGARCGDGPLPHSSYYQV
jgi:hypothetical protein